MKSHADTHLQKIRYLRKEAAKLTKQINDLKEQLGRVLTAGPEGPDFSETESVSREHAADGQTLRVPSSRNKPEDEKPSTNGDAVISNEQHSADADVLSIGSLKALSVEREYQANIEVLDRDDHDGDKVQNMEADVMFITELPSSVTCFKPISTAGAATLCKKLSVEFEGDEEEIEETNTPLGPPCQTSTMVRDGNCFFRAICHVISGSQKSHRKLRLAVVKYMEHNEDVCAPYLRKDYRCVSDYIEKSRMRFVNTWATEVEIQMMANLLGVDIHTYSRARWLSYRCAQSAHSTPGIFLAHCNDGHYNVVVCVKDLERQGCISLCKLSTERQGMQTRQRGAKRSHMDANIDEPVNIQSERAVKQGHMETSRDEPAYVQMVSTNKDERNSIYNDWYLKSVRRRKRTLQRKRYRDNVELRKAKTEATKMRYQHNLMYRSAVKESSKAKYQEMLCIGVQWKKASKVKYRTNVQHHEQPKKYNHNQRQQHLTNQKLF